MSKIAEGRKAPTSRYRTPRAAGSRWPTSRSKDVIVYFYPKDDTPGCTKEACGFRDLWKDLRKAGVVVLRRLRRQPRVPHEVLGQVQAAFHAPLGPREKVMTAWGLRREDPLREEDDGRDPLDGVDRPRRKRPQALEEGGRCRQASRPGPRGRPRRGLSRPRGPAPSDNMRHTGLKPQNPAHPTGPQRESLPMAQLKIPLDCPSIRHRHDLEGLPRPDGRHARSHRGELSSRGLDRGREALLLGHPAGALRADARRELVRRRAPQLADARAHRRGACRTASCACSSAISTST
mgnify:CR=1 FL=1